MPHRMLEDAEWLSPRKATTGFLAGERQDFRPPLPFPPFLPPSSLVPPRLSCPTSFQRAEVVYPRERGQDGTEVGSFIHRWEASEPDPHPAAPSSAECEEIQAWKPHLANNCLGDSPASLAFVLRPDPSSPRRRPAPDKL